MTPLATRIRDLLARTGKPPKRESESARHARESGCLIVGRRDCEAVLALIDAAKVALEAADDAYEVAGAVRTPSMTRRRIVDAIRALEE
jgi:hypothetical protein